MADVPFSCDCGGVTGTLSDISPKAGSHAQCHCDDCRRAIVWLGHDDPGPDGVCYFQTAPNRVTFAKGEDSLAVFTWKSEKLLRWYASCCNTPLFNTMSTPKIAFASLLVSRTQDTSPFGPIKGHAFISKPNGKTGHTGLGDFIWGMLKRTTHARVTGKWRETPFFNADGMPAASVQTLSHEDRAKARL
ncbi:DUF6151 family protein [Octadecabacter ascidiaceicola]|uniref:CENP-V/GFA domain-containing protein n=1 Tax=Octadecabacter ascidiaceicola TaxID=1655543 RepID=A0A238K5D1_9RHOB|nr:DUF6151 family protein [Octadecabacter ascidiaceicola]SMX37644.1 hypothetical protein OCA8868_01517 [Octadecabacter ascidiaceicola]